MWKFSLVFEVWEDKIMYLVLRFTDFYTSIKCLYFRPHYLKNSWYYKKGLQHATELKKKYLLGKFVNYLLSLFFVHAVDKMEERCVWEATTNVQSNAIPTVRPSNLPFLARAQCFDFIFRWKFCVNTIKVHIFWEGHKLLRNLYLNFDCMNCSQK